MKRQIIFSVIVCIAVCSVGFAGPQKGGEQGVALTIYGDNFAVVRESRQMSFEKGLNTVKFTDVASAIDPTSVNFLCLSAPVQYLFLNRTMSTTSLIRTAYSNATLIKTLRLP